MISGTTPVTASKCVVITFSTELTKKPACNKESVLSLFLVMSLGNVRLFGLDSVSYGNVRKWNMNLVLD